MRVPAFKEDPAVKAAAASDASQARHPGWSCIATDDDRMACSAAFGLALPLLNLLSHALNVPYRDGATEKLQRAISMIAVGADTEDLVRRWALDLWTQPEHGIASKLANTPAFGPASDIVRLVEASATAPIGRDVWRRARGDLNRAIAQAPEIDPYADVIVAMAWDLEATPRVSTDIWNAWSYLPKTLSDAATGWTKDKEDEVLEEYRRVLALAYAEFGPEPEGDELAPYRERHKAFTNAKMIESGHAQLFEDWLAHAERLTPRLLEWWKVIEEQLFEACAGKRGPDV